MEELMSRIQIASSCDQQGPYSGNGRFSLVDGPGKIRGSSSGKAPVYSSKNTPIESNPYIQRDYDTDVKYTAPIPRTIGASSSDISRGSTMFPSAADMPVVRKVVMFDTRTRDPALTPTAGSVTFKLDQPLFSVSRILVLDARVPIYLDPTNVGLEQEDYVMLSMGLNLADTVTTANSPLSSSATPCNRAIANIPLVPSFSGSKFASLKPLEPPGAYFTDFRTPIPNIEQIELSWWRFAKGINDSEKYIIPNTHTGTVGSVDENAYVTIAFYGRDRRPE